MNQICLIFLITYIGSCSSPKHTLEKEPVENNNQSKSSKRNYLPTCISYSGKQLDDTLKLKFKTLLASNDIKFISNDEALQLQDAETKRVYTPIFTGGKTADPQTVMRDAERLMKKVVNRINIESNLPHSIKWRIFSLPLFTSKKDNIFTHQLTTQDIDGFTKDQVIEKIAVNIILSGELKEK